MSVIETKTKPKFLISLLGITLILAQAVSGAPTSKADEVGCAEIEIANARDLPKPAARGKTATKGAATGLGIGLAAGPTVGGSVGLTPFRLVETSIGLAILGMYGSNTVLGAVIGRMIGALLGEPDRHQELGSKANSGAGSCNG